MNVEIISEPFQLAVHGFGGVAGNRNYAETAFRLSGQTWDFVKKAGLKNKGKNIWIYDTGDRVFAGLELEHDARDRDLHDLKKLTLNLPKYAYFNHIGPYRHIKQAGQIMTNRLGEMGFETTLPYVEIYGHWTNDETNLNTELLMC